ncbi:MAG: PBP1A family penicillin-binding protein [Hyphomicrobiales bacterium]|nr:PBP1A family penicillin-binding protein [Hyphomicrobiales bacterium]
MDQPSRLDAIKTRLRHAALAFDAFINSELFESSRRTRETYDRFAAFMDRFHVSGLRRLGVEAACETLTLGLGAAVVLLALAIPAFRETSDDWLKKQDLAVTFLDRYGVEVGRRGIRHDDSVTLDQMPDYLIKAVLATEDRRFFDHWGVDPIGLLRALTVNARSNTVVQGGSTITQQLAKNLFLTNERSLERKIKEAYLALWLETHLSKRQILALYLDRAYMGGGTFGVQAAADFYFGKSVKDLTLAEAAMLAGLFKAPTKFAPHINLPAARARAADVLNNLVEAGFLTQSQIFTALRNPATPIERERGETPDWYLDYAFDQVKKLADAGKLGEDRVLTVRTALDVGVQNHAQDVIEEQLRENGRDYHASQAAAVIIDPSNGAVRAIIGGRDYGVSQFNRATDAQRQPGSSFKPYVYLTALLSGRFTPNTVVVDSPVCIGNWCPHNYGGSYAGAVPLWNALQRSLNTIAVKLTTAVGNGSPKAGRALVVETARKMGVTAPLPDTVSLPIGADEVSVIEHSGAYSTFANGGMRITPFAAVEIKNSRGDVIYRQDKDGPPVKRIFPEKIIADMNSMLRRVVSDGTGRRADLGDVYRAGGKTGTTNAYKDAWFCGFTGNLNGCVWFGNDDDSPMNEMTGGTLPAQTWHDIMEFAHHGLEPKAVPGFPPPAPAGAVASAAMTTEGGAQPAARLSRKSGDTIEQIGQLIRSASGKRVDAAPGGFDIIAGGVVR